MTSYVTIPNTDIDAESPIDVDLMTALRDNPIAMGEGAVGAPGFAAVTGASFDRLAVNTHSSDASSEFLSIFSADYDEYWFHLSKVKPATDIVSMSYQLGTSGVYITTAIYQYANHRVETSAGAENTGFSAATTAAVFTNDPVGNSVDEVVEGWIRIHDPFAASYTQADWDISSLNNNTVYALNNGGSCCDSAASKTDIKFLFSVGNIASGEIIAYGVKK